MSDKEPDDGPHFGEAASKKRWQRPEMKRVGDLRELILGSGKAGSNLDADPQVANKSGVG